MRHFNHFPKEAFTYDLHVLSIPPTFVLSQDQTLQLYNCIVLILFVSLLVCFPQTFINLLLFSFQRPGVASSVTVVTGEFFAFIFVAVFLATRGESNGDGPYSQGFFSGFFQKKSRPLQLAVLK